MHEGARVVTEEQTLRGIGGYIGRESTGKPMEEKEERRIEHIWKSYSQWERNVEWRSRGIVSTPGTQDETQSKPSAKGMHNAMETEDNDKYGNAQGADSEWGSGGRRKGNSRGT